jgi:transcriptional regulator with XRE-family HTH domain
MQDERRSHFSKALIKTLQRERKALGISHEKLAEKAGISRQAIGKIESGERNPTMQTMYKLTKAMGVSLEEFVRKMDLD